MGSETARPLRISEGTIRPTRLGSTTRRLEGPYRTSSGMASSSSVRPPCWPIVQASLPGNEKA